MSNPDSNQIKQRLIEALAVLQALDLLRGQQNERSALTLLALLNLKPQMPWSQAQAPLLGITPIMDFSRIHYGKTYAPNTRETFRRFTMHQFVDAGLVVPNPDRADRPINSPKWCYQIEPNALALLRTYATPLWEGNLSTYLGTRETLQQRYKRQRDMLMIPVNLTGEQKIQLTPGRHSELIKAIVEQFGPRYAPGGQVIYVGDTGNKWAYFDEGMLKGLGVQVDIHGKMPDTVIYFPTNNWLLLIEAVTSHGPVNPKRRDELAYLFRNATAGLVYVTAFPSRTEMAHHLSEISWETEVWMAQAPTHLIHFNGIRFLGPYD